MHAFADEQVRAIFATRGGYGSNYLLDGLDLDLIAAKSQAVLRLQRPDRACSCGCSTSCSLPAFHGPMLAGGFRASKTASICPACRRRSAASLTPWARQKACAPCTPARRSGTLYGGCLSILVSLLGTPWEPQTEGKLLFLEDVGAKPYQIDRMFWQLRQAGKLEGVTRHRLRRDAGLRLAGRAARVAR